MCKLREHPRLRTPPPPLAPHPILSQIMAMGYKVPTPVQRKSLPATLAGADVVVMARTGSGKTAAFLIPVLEKLGSHSHKMGARSIILSPTRELAVQVRSIDAYLLMRLWETQRSAAAALLPDGLCLYKNVRHLVLLLVGLGRV